MKRVLEIITLAGSAEAFIGDQFSFFQEKGDYEMHLICSEGDNLETFAKKQGIKYHAVEISRQLAPVKDLKAVFKIARYIRKNKIDIIVAHYFPKASLITTCASLISGRRTKVMVAHGVLHDTMSGLVRKLVIWEQKFDVAFAKKVVCVSPSVAKRRLEDKIDKPEKQVVLGKGSCNGVDALEKFNPEKVSVEEIATLKEKYGISKDDFIIGFSGRLVRDKGVVELSQAFRILKEKHPDKSIKLFIIGEPEKRDAVPQEVLDTLLDNPEVVFTGRIPYSDIQKYYLLMDVLVLPSYREGFPTVVLEACAMGIPVIVSKSTGCIDSIKENVTGVYTDIEPQAIAHNIEKFFDRDFTRNMGREAREYIVENYDQRIVREYMLQVLDSIEIK
ncbi:MAG: glycosyltransferase family 4 protein [Prevotella sp.]|nr:glycosyltransferase family 4 protein [Prevotella sp.]